MEWKYVLFAHNASPSDPIGGKTRALAMLRGFHVPVPQWFVLTPQAFWDSLGADEREAFKTLADLKETADLVRLLDALSPSEAVRREIGHALKVLCPKGELVAVRSSAVDEDGREYSYAGQLDTFLCLPPGDVADHVAKVWRSAYNERVLAYRLEKGIRQLPPPPAVLVQQMIFPEASGVAFGADPVSGRRNAVVISSIYGLGTALVSGETDADTFHVDDNGTVYNQVIVHKQRATVYHPENPERLVAAKIKDDIAQKPSLDELQVQQVALMTRQLSDFFGQPQDVEWAFQKGRLFLLQSRPMTAIHHLPDPDGEKLSWDNGELIDSFSGVTTPLSYSFARRFYAGYYRQLARYLSLEGEGAFQHRDDLFQRTIGLIRGRVYGNMTVLAQLSAELPGLRLFERYTRLVADAETPESLPPPLPRRDTLRLKLRLLKAYWRLPKTTWKLQQEIRAVLMNANVAVMPSLKKMRPDQLAHYYRHLEYLLATEWDAPVLTNYVSDIFYGLLLTLCRGWCGDASLCQDLLSGEGEMASVEAAQLMEQMARFVAGHPELMEILCGDDPLAAAGTLQAEPVFATIYRQYMEQFGDRTLEDLKLESDPLYLDPTLLMKNVGMLARKYAGNSPDEEIPEQTGAAGLRMAGEARVNEALAGHPLRRWIFFEVLRRTRRAICERENLRLELTRVVGRIRLIVRELGHRFRASNILADPADVFCLTVDEMLGIVDGTTATVNLRGLVALRKQEFEVWRKAEPPTSRFETQGMVWVGNRFKAQLPEVSLLEDHLKGQGCCPGIARGRARIVVSPQDAVLEQGSVLIAERSDPAWVMLFSGVAGVVFETGSPLCHAAIVAREMGIPAVVSVRGLTRWLKDGDWVEIDGRAGTIRKIKPPAAS